MFKFLRGGLPAEVSEQVRVAAGGREEVLAAVELTDGRWVAGSRSAVYLPEDDKLRRVGWEGVERAAWDSEAGVLRVFETTAFGTPLRTTDLPVEDPGRFGQLLRERVNASVLVQRHVPLSGKKGIRIVGRRNPATPDAPVAWNFVLDKGLEPDQPGLMPRAEAALREVRDEFGI